MCVSKRDLLFRQAQAWHRGWMDGFKESGEFSRALREGTKVPSVAENPYGPED